MIIALLYIDDATLHINITYTLVHIGKKWKYKWIEWDREREWMREKE